MSDISKNVFVTKVVKDEESGELVILFPPDFLERLGWVEDDVLVWLIEDGQVTIRKYIKEEE